MKSVSIITISYNNAVGLDRTIQSVINQSYTNYEYIVIDGGSNDGSRDVIKKYESQIDYWISEPDKGIYNAMNKGLAQARGQYIHFLNSADVYASNDVLESFFSKRPTESFLRGVQICDYGDRQERWLNIGDRGVTVYDMYINTLLHQATFIRRDLFAKYGYYDEKLKIVSDWKFFLQAILGGEKTTFQNKDIVIFEMYGISTNKEHGAILLKERAAVLSELMPSNTIKDYERLKELENDAYIVEFTKSNNLIFSIFRVFRRVCLLLGVSK